jgi:hypothetical protein
MSFLRCSACTLLPFALSIAAAQLTSAQSTPSVNVPPEHPITVEQLQTLLQELKMIDATRKLTMEELERQRNSLPPWFPQDVWDSVEKKVMAIDIVKVQLPIYQRSFSQDNADAMILLFQGPLGQQLATNYLAQRVAIAHTGAQGAEADKEAIQNATANKALGTQRLNELSPVDRQRILQAQQVMNGIWQSQSNDLASSYDDLVNGVVQKEIAAHNQELAAAQQSYSRKSSANSSTNK